MKRFILLPLGYAEPTSEIRDEWERWFERIKDHVVDSGNPFGEIRQVTSRGSMKLSRDETAVAGYVVIDARDMDEAVEIARTCPAPGGTRVHEQIDAGPVAFVRSSRRP